MVKRISQLMMLGLSFLLLSGCQQQLSIEEAATLFVEGEFYLREKYQDESFTTKYAQAFGERLTEATLWESETQTAVALAKQNVPEEVRKAIGPALSEALGAKTSFTVKKIGDNTVAVTITGLDLNDFEGKLTTALEQELLVAIKEAGFEKIKTMDDLTRLDSTQDLKKIAELVTDFQGDTGGQQEILVATIADFEPKTTPKVVEIKLSPQDEKNGQWKIENQEAVLEKLTEAFLN